MNKYLTFLSNHKRLSLKRKTDRGRQIGVVVFLCALVVPFGLAFFPMLMEEADIISPFVLPALIILDFSFRFFIKKNQVQ